MKTSFVFSGSGGQGIMSAGITLAQAAIDMGKHATYLPEYGPEQRGGTANVTVIVSDERISSPIISSYDTAIILNQPSLDRFQSAIKPGGTLIYDGYGISVPPTRTDISIFEINAMDTAAEMGNAKGFNMIVLGALLRVRPIVTIDNVLKALRKTLPERHYDLIPANEEALRKGMEIIHI